MADRRNHYEAAFEAYVRARGVPCVAIDEAKRPLDGDDAEALKNPDFLVYPRLTRNLVVEVKGKRGKDRQGRRPWESWVTTDDLDALDRWQRLFGPGFRAMLAFVYVEPLNEWTPELLDREPGPQPDRAPTPGARRRRGPDLEATGGAFPFRGRAYWFWGVGLDDYVQHLRSRGPAWKAVAMARDAFRSRVRPLSEWLPMTSTDPTRPRPASPASRRGRLVPGGSARC